VSVSEVRGLDCIERVCDASTRSTPLQVAAVKASKQTRHVRDAFVSRLQTKHDERLPDLIISLDDIQDKSKALL
jgi:hypothetical protein